MPRNPPDGSQARRWRGATGWIGALLLGAAVLVSGVTPGHAEQHAREAALAQQAVEQATRRVEDMERVASTAPGKLAEARMQRSDLVMAWRRQADAWAADEPRNPDASHAVAASEHAMAAYYVPGGGLAPESGQDP